MKKLSYKIALFVVAALALAACHKYNPVDPNAGVKELDIDWQKTHTIAQFLDEFMTECGDVANFPPRERSYKGASKSNQNLGLFSVDLVKSDKPVIIVGRIVSEDRSGNVYKTLYIQDVDFPDQGLKISVDAGSLSGIYAKGQVIALRCNDLAVGKYARMPQIGIPYFNDAKEGRDNAGKIGWEVGRIPVAIFKEHVQLVGRPDPSKIVVHNMSIQEIKATADDTKSISRLTSRLVRIDNIHFVPYTWNNNNLDPLNNNFDCANDGKSKTFAPTTDNIGYPQSRCFTYEDDDESGERTLALGTSEFAKFACSPLPTSDFYGSIQGVMSYYHDNGRYSVSPNKVWSIVVNGLEDIKLVSYDGTEWKTDESYYTNY